MNIKQIIQNKRPGFYIGAAGALLALVTLFIYIAMDSMFFTPLVVLGLIGGIVFFLLAAFFRVRAGYMLSCACYMFAMYHFLVLEVEYRMDVLVDPAQGLFALDGIFYAAVVMFFACIIVTLVASCLKQEKEK